MRVPRMENLQSISRASLLHESPLGVAVAPHIVHRLDRNSIVRDYWRNPTDCLPFRS